MLVLKIVMEPLPNIHPVAVLTVTYSVVFGYKAFIPLGIFVILNGVIAGFNVWWLPYLYIWLPLVALTLIVPKKAPEGVKAVFYIIICALHGISYGTLYAPAQALMFGLNFKETLAWIAAGFPFDVIHSVSNAFLGTLVYPLSKALSKAVEKVK